MRIERDHDLEAQVARSKKALVDGPLHQLRDIRTCGVAPKSGVYTLWHDTEFLYVGCSYKDPGETTNRQAAGVVGRLDTYRRARLTSDFTFRIFLRYIVPELTAGERRKLRSGDLIDRDMQERVHSFLNERISFRVYIVGGDDARWIEGDIRRRGLPRVGRPLFNPLKNVPTVP